MSPSIDAEGLMHALSLSRHIHMIQKYKIMHFNEF